MLFLLLMLIIGYFIVQDLAIIDNQSNNSERMRSSEISVEMESDHAIVRENGKVKRKLNRRCPHAGCPVNYDEDKNEFVCPCHQSKVNIKGDFIVDSGPARDNLAPYP